MPDPQEARARAEKLKAEGNALFQRQKWGAAIDVSRLQQIYHDTLLLHSCAACSPCSSMSYPRTCKLPCLDESSAWACTL